MKVNEQTGIVKAMAEHWVIISSLLSGTAGMRKNKALLPKWPNEEDNAYNARLAVATLLPALKRTIMVMVGKPFSKELTLGDDVPTIIEEYCQDINLEGQSLHSFSIQVFDEVMSYGLCGILVDFPVAPVATEGRVRTVADEKAMKLRPYFTFVKHGQILGWRTRRIDGALTLTQLRIMEEVEEDDGAFGTACIPQVRVLEPGRWATYRESGEGALREWKLFEEGVTTLTYIPFIPFYGKRLAYMVGESPLQDLAYLNVKHWQSQSDQDTILHVARVPILAIIGAEAAGPDGKGGTQLVVGASAGVKLPMDADMKYVEHTGKAIEAGAQSLKDLEDQMVQTGAELLVVKPGDKSATEANNEAEANKSDLQRIVENFEDSMDQSLQVMADWLKQPEGGHIQLFKDFGSFLLSDASAQLVLQMQQSGLLTKETALTEMQRRGVISPDIDPADELVKAEEEGPELGAAGIDPATGLPRVAEE